MTLSYTGDSPVTLAAPDGQLVNVVIRDNQGNIVYNWEKEKYGPPPSGPAPSPGLPTPPPLSSLDQGWLPGKQIKVDPGWSGTARLSFKLPAPGEYYIEGALFGGWGYGQVLARYETSGGGIFPRLGYVKVTVG